MFRFVLLLLVLAGAACERRTSGSPDQAAGGAGEVPTRESWNVRFLVYESPLESDDARPQLELQAPHLAVYDAGDTTRTVLSGVKDSARVTARLFDDAGQPSATVRADRIVYFDNDRRFEAHGRVVVETRGDKRLQSDDLFWDEATRHVRTPGFTRLTTPNERIQGYGFVADETLETYSLARVTGTGTIEEE